MIVYQWSECIQWNPSITATLGELNFGRYIGVAFIEGLFCTRTVHLGPGFLAVIQIERVAFIQGWLLRGVPLHVAIEYTDIIHSQLIQTVNHGHMYRIDEVKTLVVFISILHERSRNQMRFGQPMQMPYYTAWISRSRGVQLQHCIARGRERQRRPAAYMALSW